MTAKPESSSSADPATSGDAEVMEVQLEQGTEMEDSHSKPQKKEKGHSNTRFKENPYTFLSPDDPILLTLV